LSIFSFTTFTKQALGNIYGVQNDFQKSLSYLQEACEIAQKLYQEYPSEVDLQNDFLTSLSAVAEVYLCTGNLSEALEKYIEVSGQMTHLIELYPQKTEFLESQALWYAKIAHIYKQQSHNELAIKYFLEAKKLWQNLSENIELPEYKAYLKLVHQELKTM